jgi:hypothetical protein
VHDNYEPFQVLSKQKNISSLLTNFCSKLYLINLPALACFGLVLEILQACPEEYLMIDLLIQDSTFERVDDLSIKISVPSSLRVADRVSSQGAGEKRIAGVCHSLPCCWYLSQTYFVQFQSRQLKIRKPQMNTIFFK